MSDLFDDKNISPMLLHQAKQPFDDADCIYELKLDGIRCIAYLDKRVVLHNKRHKDITHLFPELSNIYRCVDNKTIVDGELVCLVNGKPDFFALQTRSLMQDKFRIQLSANANAVQLCVFDILYYNGQDLTGKPLLERKALLQQYVAEGNGLAVSRYIEQQGIAFFQLAKQQQLEGIVAKQKKGLYHIGKRTRDWIKIKVMQDEDLLICGYQYELDGLPKDLILGYYDNNNVLQCRGKVYLGVSKQERLLIYNYARHNSIATAHFPQYKDVVWLVPQLVGTVQFMHSTQSGSMRQPVWKGLRTDS